MKNKERGQALIELIVFLPLMITLYSVIAGFASSINGSINQQKVTRAYFYYRIQNNSNIPGPKSGDWEAWSQFGMFYIGWKERFEGDSQPVMPCYKVSIPFKDEPTDKCDEKGQQLGIYVETSSFGSGNKCCKHCLQQAIENATTIVKDETRMQPEPILVTIAEITFDSMRKGNDDDEYEQLQSRLSRNVWRPSTSKEVELKQYTI